MPSKKKKTAAPIVEEQFPFVVTTGPDTPSSPEIRTMIRRQAMRKAGTARKARGNHGKTNLGQYPDFEDSSSTNEPANESPYGEDESEAASRQDYDTTYAANSNVEIQQYSYEITGETSDYKDRATGGHHYSLPYTTQSAYQTSTTSTSSNHGTQQHDTGSNVYYYPDYILK